MILRVRAELLFGFLRSSITAGVGNKPASVPSVGSTDTASRNNVRLHFVSSCFQVRAHLVEDHSFRPINNSENVLAHDPTGSNSPNNPQHFRPEVAVVLRALALTREAERLAGGNRL